MRDHGNWSISLGRWGGLRVRLHMFFLLFAALTVYVGSLNATSGIGWIAAASLAILLASVILHELSHYHAAVRLGGSMDETVLMPWGGVASMRPPRSARREMFTHLAGPAANLILCLVCIPGLIALGDVKIWALLHPIHPDSVADGSAWPVIFKLTFWINWMLVLVNLIPAFPFDGGRALRAGLSQWCGRNYAANIVGRVSQLFALCLVIIGVLLWNDRQGAVPTWLPLVLLAIFLWFSARQEHEQPATEQMDDDLFGYDFSQGYTSLERSTESLDENEEQEQEDESSRIASWLEQRRAARIKREQETEAEEERRVDEILAKLHDGGMHSLSVEEREILHRVSERYRNRQGG